MASTEINVQHVNDDRLVAIADEIDLLQSAAIAPSQERDALYHRWISEASAAGIKLGSVEGLALSERIGHTQKDNEAAEYWNRIASLQEQSRGYRPLTIQGLFAKARILRHSMGPEFNDVARDDQDWNVLLFNEFFDAIAPMAREATPMSPILTPAIVELRAELERADAERSAIWAKADANPHDDVIQKAYNEALLYSWKVLDQIAEIHAASLADLKVKAWAMDWSAKLLDDEPYHNPSDGEEKIMRQLVAGLLDERIS